MHAIKKRFAFLFLLSFILLLKFASSTNNQEFAYVSKVIDGDTIKLKNGETIRYIGINAPERDEYLYEEAKLFNKKLVEHKEVLLKFDIQLYDDYGRKLAYVFTKDNKFVNAELIRNGFAYLYPHPFETSFFNELLKAQRTAITNNAGIFKNILKETAPYYLGSKKGLRFHRPSCKHASQIYKKNRILFKSKKEAFWNGYAPCKTCNP
jgi:endonuclease YncB( thermonuclease family)